MVLVHRLVGEITRGRIPAADRTTSLRVILGTVNAVAPFNADDVRTWGLLEALRWAPDEIEQQLHELIRPPRSEGP
jgi:hypothetical protein